MFDVQITPAHGLKQSVDYALPLDFPAEYGITAEDSARMELRYDLLDLDPVDTLTQDNGRITITVTNGAAQVVLLFDGDASRTYPLKNERSLAYYREMTADEATIPPGVTEPKKYIVLPLFGTLIITSPGGLDRAGASMDALLLFEASYTR